MAVDRSDYFVWEEGDLRFVTPTPEEQKKTILDYGDGPPVELFPEEIGEAGS